MRKNRIIFDQLTIENVLTFKEKQVIPLNGMGVTSVIGINNETGGSNGAGKTTLWNILTYLLYSKTVLGISKNGLLGETKKDLFIELAFRKDEDKWLAQCFRNHKKEGTVFKIFKNKKPWGYKKKSDKLQALLPEILGISMKEFDGSVIWSQDKIHTLTNGLPTERTNWISSMFNIDRYDDVYDILNKKLKSINKEIEDLKEYEIELKNINDDLSELKDINKINDDIEEIKDKRKRIKTKLDKIEDKTERTKNQIVEIKNALEIQSELNSQGRSDESVDEIESNLKSSKKELNKWQEELSSYKMELKQARRKNELKNKLAQYDDIDPTDLDDIHEKINKLEKLIIKLEKDDSDTEDKIKELEKRDNLEKKLDGDTTEELEELEEKNKKLLIEATEKYSVAKSRVKELSNIEGESKCPLCKSEINPEHIEEELKKYKKDLKEYKEKSDKYEDRVDELKERILISKEYDDLVEITKNKKEYPEGIRLVHYNIKEALKSTEKKLSKTNKHKKDSKEILSITQEIKAIGKVKKISVIKESIEDKETLIEERQDYITNIQLIVTNTRKLESILEKYKVRESKLKKLLNKLNEDKEALNERRNIGFNRHNKASQKLGILKNLKDTVSDKLEKKKKLKENLKNLPDLKYNQKMYTALADAYGKKGLKVDKLRSIINALKERLPYYTDILFSEKNITFKAKDDDTKLELLVCRSYKNDNKKINIEFDVKTLSGGERTRFSIALIFTLDDLISPLKRTNLIVLDEIDKSVDEIGKNIMVDKLIPMLSERGGSVFIISHNKEISKARCYNHTMKVIKDKKGRSSIKIKKVKNLSLIER